MWTRVADVSELQEQQWKMVMVNGREIGLWRAKTECYAVLNICPHARAPVCKGEVTGRVVCRDGRPDYDCNATTLRCPWHRWEFDLKSGAAVVPIRQRLKTFAVRIESSEVQIDV